MLGASYVTISAHAFLTGETLLSALGTNNVGGTNWSIVGATGGLTAATGLFNTNMVVGAGAPFSNDATLIVGTRPSSASYASLRFWQAANNILGIDLGNDGYLRFWFYQVSWLEKFSLSPTGAMALADGLTATTGTFSGAITCTTIDTGQGANELYDMNQNVQTSDSPTFAGLTLTAFSGFVKATAGVLSAAALVDADIPDTITLTNITQITNRSHTNLGDIGSLTHATIDSYLDQAVKTTSSPTLNNLYLTGTLYADHLSEKTVGHNIFADKAIVITGDYKYFEVAPTAYYRIRIGGQGGDQYIITYNAYHTGAVWARDDVGQPSWLLTQDRVNDRFLIERASVAGFPTFVPLLILSNAGAMTFAGGLTVGGGGAIGTGAVIDSNATLVLGVRGSGTYTSLRFWNTATNIWGIDLNPDGCIRYWNYDGTWRDRFDITAAGAGTFASDLTVGGDIYVGSGRAFKFTDANYYVRNPANDTVSWYLTNALKYYFYNDGRAWADDGWYSFCPQIGEGFDFKGFLLNEINKPNYRDVMKCICGKEIKGLEGVCEEHRPQFEGTYGKQISNMAIVLSHYVFQLESRISQLEEALKKK